MLFLNILVKAPPRCHAQVKELFVTWAQKLAQPLLFLVMMKKWPNIFRGTGRAEVADVADSLAKELTGDPEVYANPEKYFDQVIEINLSELEPHINGPFTPDLAWPISKFAAAVKENGWPENWKLD